MDKRLDVICLGRAAVDLYGEQTGGRLEDMQSFSKYLGGSSGNLAAGLARLGSRSSMLTRVGNEAMGRFVQEALDREGVDTSHVVTDPERLTGLVILGIADRDSFPHIFYRKDCADMALEADDIDEDYIASSRALAITGTHLSSERTFEAVRRAVALARANVVSVVLDIDYRPVLWGLTDPGQGEERFVASDSVTGKIRRLLPDIDLLVGTEEEINIAGGSTDTMQSLHSIRERSTATIVVKRGPMGCAVFESDIPRTVDEGISVRGVEVEVLNVLGAGDAFLSGFLHAWLNGQNWQECARSGNACGALVVSRHGCTPAMPTKIELDDFLARASTIERPDRDPRIRYLHSASTRPPTPANLYVMAFDHRRQLEDIAISTEPPVARISRFKSLLCDAVLQVANGPGDHSNLGIIVDDRYGEQVLSRMTHRQWWIGRPVEVPGSKPLEFDACDDIGLAISKWPARQIVKCLVFYHPDDDLQLRLQQEARVRQLSSACAELGRELLLEIIAGSDAMPYDDHTVANILRRFYNLGVLPSWWKLEAQSAAAWSEIGEVIERYDPHCHGVLLLGLDAPEAELRESFRIAAPNPLCRGFAVGRSIFGESARGWFGGQLDDDAVIEQVATNYRTMIRYWQDAESDTAKLRQATV